MKNKTATALWTALPIVGTCALVGAVYTAAYLITGTSLLATGIIASVAVGATGLVGAVLGLIPEGDDYPTRAKTAAVCGIASIGLIFAAAKTNDALKDMHGALRAASSQAFQPMADMETAARRAVTPPQFRSTVIAARPDRPVSA